MRNSGRPSLSTGASTDADLAWDIIHYHTESAERDFAQRIGLRRGAPPIEAEEIFHEQLTRYLDAVDSVKLARRQKRTQRTTNGDLKWPTR